MTKAEKTMFLSVLATPIAREGWPFIAVFGIATLILFIFSTALGWIGIISNLNIKNEIKVAIRLDPT